MSEHNEKSNELHSLERFFPTIMDALEVLTERLHLEYYALHIDTPSVPPTIKHTYPKEWIDHYLDQSYYKKDLAIINSSSLGHLWDVDKVVDPGAKVVFSEAADHKIISGCTYQLPFLENSTKVFLTLSSSKNHFGLQNKINAHSHEIGHLFYLLTCLTISTLYDKPSPMNQDVEGFDQGYLKQLQEFVEKINDEVKRERIINSSLLVTNDFIQRIPTQYQTHLSRLFNIVYKYIKKDI